MSVDPDPSTRHGIEPGPGTVWQRAQRSEDFVQLKRTYRSFAFPMVIGGLAFYFTYVLLTAFARGFVNTRLFDSNITVKGMNPAFVGPYLFKAVEENHMYKVPHMHTHEQIRARHRRIESDLEREEALHEKYAPLQKY